MGEESYQIKLDQNACKGIDAYLEYRRIVGDDDGGKLFTPEEYEQYKKKVLPMRIKNRLYVTYTNPEGMDCICVGPETECFCQHRFKQHKTDFESIPENPEDRLLVCQVKGCKCATFHYTMKNGGQPVRCHCKHETPAHAEVPPFICKQRNCKCVGYKSSFTCDCGYPAFKHYTIIETREEREARGHPVGQDVGYKAMGGITGFSSLAAGMQRLDPSGAGLPSEEFLNQPITSMDHPFLRANVNSIKQHKLANNDIYGAMVDQDERVSQMRRPGESELDYYERRYQEREKAKFRGGGGPQRISAEPQVRGQRTLPGQQGKQALPPGNTRPNQGNAKK